MFLSSYMDNFLETSHAKSGTTSAEMRWILSLTACNGAGSQPFFVVAVAAITALVSLLVYAALSATLIKLCKKQRAVVVNAGDSEDNVIYTDVTVNKRKTEARLQDSARQQFFI
ncbi:hypothetical protein FQA47_021609 [Oryzias melastigma]|uniref:Uncharacterized protein n=1 Tax=Oryzias melastigma TaxID=30732 RepID=A0A834C341_ORYME|nr:hypothetical protein FQA47_021609 [Oryzias melastigma]